MSEKGAKNPRTVRRIRSSPDLLVYDDERRDLMLVEVKMRRAPDEAHVVLYTNFTRLRNFKEFWDDSILVLVVPCSNIFYAQRAAELEIKPKYDLNRDFERFDEIFPKSKTIDLSYFKEQALQLMQE